MAIRRSRAINFHAVGVSDTFDSTDVFAGAMAQLSNLIPAPQMQDGWVPRPASVQVFDFGDFGQGEALFDNGTRVYGFLQEGTTFPGKSRPFCFDFTTGTFVPVAGVTAGNLPNATSNTGDWIPPTIDRVGGFIIFTHPGFALPNAFGWLDITTPANYANPVWHAGNLAVTPLLAVPTAVAQYAGCACFAVNTSGPTIALSSAVVFSDAGNPLTCTNTPVSQIATFQNGVSVTALKGLPLNTLTGGIIQSLIAFQGPSAAWQLTGSPAEANLAINMLNDSIGTFAPNSICATPKGLLFAAPDGIRRITLLGTIEKVLGRRGMGVSTPFLFAQFPSRMAAAYNESVYRISVQNAAVAGTPTQEWWYHEEDDRWSGPHTFPATVICPTQVPHAFAMFPVGIPHTLWSSDGYATLAALYVENGVQMTYAWQCSLLPDAGQMNMNALVESGIGIAFPLPEIVQITATNERGAVIGATQIQGIDGTGALWGTAIWGVALWGAGQSNFRQLPINYPQPLVFKQMQVRFAGNCIGGLKIGNHYLRYSELGYNILTETQAA